MKRAAIGVSAHMGWAATAVVTVEAGRLRVIRTGRIETARPDDRAAREPYHVAGGIRGLARVPRPPDPESALERGLNAQRRATARSIARLVDELESRGYRLARAGILTGRGRPAASFAKATGSHTQIHIQEGLAVRESIRAALDAQRVEVRLIDHKSLDRIAETELDDANSQLQTAQPDDGGAWRKEEKQAATAAWLALKRLR